MTSAWEKYNALKEPNELLVPLLRDAETAAEWNDVVQTLTMVERLHKNKNATAADLTKAKSALRITKNRLIKKGSAIEFRLRALGTDAFQGILDKYPQKDQQLRSMGMLHDPDKAMPELLEACIVEPQMSRTEIDEMLSGPKFSPGELGPLTRGVMELHSENFLAADWTKF